MTNILLIIAIMMLGFIIFRITVRSFKTAYVQKGIRIGGDEAIKLLIEEAKKDKPFKLTRNKDIIWLEIVKKNESIS